MRNTFPNHPDELSSSCPPELSYQHMKLLEPMDTDTRLSYLVLWHHITSPKIPSTTSCVLNETQWEPGSHSFQKPLCWEDGLQAGAHSLQTSWCVCNMDCRNREVPGFSGPTIKGDGGWITPSADGNLKWCAVGHRQRASATTQMIIKMSTK